MFRHRDLASVDDRRRDEDLRLEADHDPFVEAAAERLRTELSALDAVDRWGRPVAWRQVARIALGQLATPRVRDALTVEVLEEAVETQPAVRSVSPLETDRAVEWRSFFQAIDQTDRLLRE